MNTEYPLYRVALTSLALVLVIWVVPVGARAQWLHLKTPGIPRSADGKPNLTAPMFFGKGGRARSDFRRLRLGEPAGKRCLRSATKISGAARAVVAIGASDVAGMSGARQP